VRRARGADQPGGARQTASIHRIGDKIGAAFLPAIRSERLSDIEIDIRK